MLETLKAANLTIGVVGLEKEGAGIAAALLCAGHHVIAIAASRAEGKNAKARIIKDLKECNSLGLVKTSVSEHMARLLISCDYKKLIHCALVQECADQQLEETEQIFQQIAYIVAPTTVIASNNSQINLAIFQKGTHYPKRFLGIYWPTPAFSGRYIKIMSGTHTGQPAIVLARHLANLWDKEWVLMENNDRPTTTSKPKPTANTGLNDTSLNGCIDDIIELIQPYSKFKSASK